jgi:DNA-binding transcriptional LysR family regulator
MDIGQLHAFVQVASLRSFSRAAEALGLTQPSVTARIQSLERDVGEALFERNGRGVTLTEFGAAFLPYAQRVLKALQDGRDAIRQVQRLEAGTLRLAAAPTISTYVLPGLLTEFRKRHPGLEVSVRTEYSDQIAQMVLADEVQLGLERSISHPDVVTVELYEDEVVLVTAPGHPLAELTSVPIEDVGQRRLIMFNRGSSYYKLVDNALREAGVLVTPSMELDNMEATKKMVQQGLGVAFLPKVAVERELRVGELRQVGLRGMTMPKRQIALIYRRGRPLSRAAEAFVRLLEERYGIKAPLPEAATPGRTSP